MLIIQDMERPRPQLFSISPGGWAREVSPGFILVEDALACRRGAVAH
jgi:hypothetical protein